jgi:hypothetical protein
VASDTLYSCGICYCSVLQECLLPSFFQTLDVGLLHPLHVMMHIIFCCFFCEVV